MIHSGHKSCTHVRYRMTCEQYDGLRTEADGRCQICGQMEPYAPARRLYIDHDKELGYWAVRGLLCLTCNQGLDRKVGAITGPEVDKYRANAWYSRLPYAHLIKPEVPEDGPVLDPKTAIDLVVSAVGLYVQARDGGTRRERAESTDVMRAAVRTAARSGVRQVDISRATGGILSRERVYTIVRERRRQPVLPI